LLLLGSLFSLCMQDDATGYIFYVRSKTDCKLVSSSAQNHKNRKSSLRIKNEIHVCSYETVAVYRVCGVSPGEENQSREGFVKKVGFKPGVRELWGL